MTTWCFKEPLPLPMIGKITRQCIKWPREAAANKCRKSLNQRHRNKRWKQPVRSSCSFPEALCSILTVSRTLKNPKNSIQDTCKNLLKGRAISQEVIKKSSQSAFSKCARTVLSMLGHHVFQHLRNRMHVRGFRVLLTLTQVLLPKIRPPSSISNIPPNSPLPAPEQLSVPWKEKKYFEGPTRAFAPADPFKLVGSRCDTDELQNKFQIERRHFRQVFA